MSVRPDRKVAVPLRPTLPGPPEHRAETMELRDHLEVLRRRKWVVIATLVSVVLAVFAVTHYVLKEKYTASSTLRVVSRSAVSTTDVRSDDIQYLDRLANTYAKLATSAPLVAALERELQLSSRPAIAASAKPNTELLSIGVTTPSAALSTRAANALSVLLIGRLHKDAEAAIRISDAQFVQHITEVEGEIAREQTQVDALLALGALTPDQKEQLLRLQEDVRIKRVSSVAERTAYESSRISQQQRANTLEIAIPASPPTRPSSPRVKLNIALGFFFGLIGGVALAFLLENLSTRLQSTEEIQATSGIPVLAQIPSVKFTDSKPLFSNGSIAEESFRRLRTTLFAMGRDTPLRSLLITSAEQNEGKSTIVSNLALSIALSGHKVLVVDADLRLPTQHKRFEIENEVGLSDVLRGEVTAEDAIQPTAVPGLFVLPAGGRVDDATELLRAGMHALVSKLTRSFEGVLIDSPALLPVADGLAIAPEVDGVLLVAGRAQTRRNALEMACTELARFDVRPIGIIVNRTDEGRSYQGYYA